MGFGKDEEGIILSGVASSVRSGKAGEGGGDNFPVEVERGKGIGSGGPDLGCGHVEESRGRPFGALM
jgi:hypothetical protein